jgi:hypothetical protein
MDFADDAVFLGIDVGAHRQRFVKTNNRAEILDQQEVLNQPIIDEAGIATGFVETYDQCVEEVRSFLGQDQLAGIALGSPGPPNSDGTFGFAGGPFLIKTLPIMAHAFGVPLSRCAWTNDCTAGAITAASPWGHQRQSFHGKNRPEVAVAGESFRFRFRERRGDTTRNGYSKVVYATMSSSMNEGCVIVVDMGEQGEHYLIDKGEFQATPEAGHQYYKETDPFGNPFGCWCGGAHHLESALAGGLGVTGVSGMMKKAVATGKVRSGALYDAVKSVPEGSGMVGDLTLAPKLYGIPAGADPHADRLKAFVAEAVAHRIGYYWGVVGAGKVEFGGGMMHSYEQILLPALQMVLAQPERYAAQPRDMSTFPDIAVADRFGDDHIWKGPLFMLLHKDRFMVTGEANFR